MFDKTNRIRNIISQNQGRFFTVDFVKKDGTERRINGSIRYVPGHDQENLVAHLENYITVVLPKKDNNGNAQFRNVNTETVKCLSVGGKTYTF